MTRVRLGSEERRRAIVAAAVPLFARNGFAGTTTKEIARGAGVSEALLFQHFPSKVALYEAIVAQGCLGDPDLQKLAALPPSTATLVRMTRLMLEHLVSGALGDPVERDIRHRLTLNSLLHDGVYARHVFAWVTDEVLPLFRASLEAAARAGDLVPGARFSINDFWFGEHVAAMMAYVRLPGRSALAYQGEEDEVMEQALLFILRGLGLRETAIDRHLDADAASVPNDEPVPA